MEDTDFVNCGVKLTFDDVKRLEWNEWDLFFRSKKWFHLNFIEVLLVHKSYQNFRNFSWMKTVISGFELNEMNFDYEIFCRQLSYF